MSELDEMPPPMDRELRDRLRRASGLFDDEARAHAGHAFERLAQALPGLALPSVGAGDAGTAAGAGAAKAATSAGTAASVGGSSLLKLALPLVASAIVGGGVGAAVKHEVAPVRERIVYVDRPAAVVAPSSSSPSLPSPSSAPDRALRVDELPMTGPVTASSVATPTAPSARLAAERLLLDSARSAFASGDYEKALVLLRHHAERHPGGVLVEEREALTIRSLAALGRKGEAETRARAFVARYPESIMRPAVEAAVAGR